MKKSLYEIETTYLELMSQVEDAEGEITPEMEKALEITEKDRDIKSISYLEVIRKKETFNLMVDNEIKRLTAIKKSNNSLVDRLKNNLLGAVNLFGEFTVGTVTFCTRKSTSVEIEDEDKIAKEYKVQKVTTSISKTLIKKALEKDVEVIGASLSTNYSLRIK